MDESPFASAASWYDGGRAPYAPGALEHVIAGLDLDANARVVDLGCGPGSIAIPLSCTVAEVVAVDPSANMLAQGRRLAAEAGRDNIRWVQGRAEDALPDLGRFRAVTLGQSLHWMDRDLVLRLLAEAIEDGGGLAILDEGLARTPESWAATAAEVAGRYVARPRRHPGKHPEVDHVPSLRRSTHFADFNVREFEGEITRGIASILACVYSSVSTSRALFGERATAFEADLAQALLRLEPSGQFRETVVSAVYLAPKTAGIRPPPG